MATVDLILDGLERRMDRRLKQLARAEEVWSVRWIDTY